LCWKKGGKPFDPAVASGYGGQKSKLRVKGEKGIRGIKGVRGFLAPKLMCYYQSKNFLGAGFSENLVGFA